MPLVGVARVLNGAGCMEMPCSKRLYEIRVKQHTGFSALHDITSTSSNVLFFGLLGDRQSHHRYAQSLKMAEMITIMAQEPTAQAERCILADNRYMRYPKAPRKMLP